MRIIGKLIIDGNSVYEVDEECIRKQGCTQCKNEAAVSEAEERQKKQRGRKAADNR